MATFIVIRGKKHSRTRELRQSDSIIQSGAPVRLCQYTPILYVRVRGYGIFFFTDQLIHSALCGHTECTHLPEVYRGREKMRAHSAKYGNRIKK